MPASIDKLFATKSEFKPKLGTYAETDLAILMDPRVDRFLGHVLDCDFTPGARERKWPRILKLIKYGPRLYYEAWLALKRRADDHTIEVIKNQEQ